MKSVSPESCGQEQNNDDVQEGRSLPVALVKLVVSLFAWCMMADIGFRILTGRALVDFPDQVPVELSGPMKLNMTIIFLSLAVVSAFRSRKDFDVDDAVTALAWVGLALFWTDALPYVNGIVQWIAH